MRYRSEYANEPNGIPIALHEIKPVNQMNLEELAKRIVQRLGLTGESWAYEAVLDELKKSF